MSCGVVIAAAGQGKRMGIGINKQFIELNGKPILIHTIEKFYNKQWVDEIIIVVHPEELNIVQQLLNRYNLEVTKLVLGGAERQDSIEKGLSYIRSEWVMVHDGARPFVSPVKLDELYETVKQKEAAVLGVPVKDTIKIVDKSGIIDSTPDRKGLWAIQTPQAFRLSTLINAYKKARETNFLGTDDSSLVERLGIKVHIVKSDYSNIKITTPDDLAIGEIILNNWGKQND